MFGLLVALLTLPRRALVEHRRTSVDYASLVVAHLAGHPLVRAVEFESGMAAVIEFRGAPGENRVALGASCFAARGMKLAAVYVSVASGAILGGAAEGDAADAALQGGLVAGQAIHGGMAAQ